MGKGGQGGQEEWGQEEWRQGWAGTGSNRQLLPAAEDKDRTGGRERAADCWHCAEQPTSGAARKEAPKGWVCSLLLHLPAVS